MLVRNTVVAGLVATATMASATVAHATAYDTLSAVAGTYNVYTVGDMGAPGSGNAYSSDSQGSMAIGGDVYLQGFGAHGDVLAGGDINVQWGQIDGDAVAGGSVNLNGAGVLGAVSQNATVTPVTGMSFAQVSADLFQASSDLADLVDTGTVGLTPWGELTLTGSNNDINVFSLTTAQMTSLSSFTIDAPTDSTVIINVDGTTWSGSNFGFFLNRIENTEILFNFFEATDLAFTGLGWQGSILAPNAEVTALNGNFDGSVMVGSLVGVTYQNAEFHNQFFAGDFPTEPTGGPGPNDTPVPAPASLPLLLAGLAAFGWLRQRRKG